MTQKPSKLNFGNLEIPDPCSVPWTEMHAQSNGNRHCSHCNHIVHDLTGMSAAEIESLYNQMGGKLCGAVSVDELGNPIYFRDVSSPKKVRFLKHWVAAASLFFLYQAPQAGRASTISLATHLLRDEMAKAELQASGIETVTPATNTLISGLIVTEDSSEIHDSLEVEIYQNGEKLVTIQSVSGFFHHDFESKLQPTDKITLVVLAKTFNPATYNERKYGGAKLTTTVGHGQNIKILVSLWEPPRMKMAGKMMKSSVR